MIPKILSEVCKHSSKKVKKGERRQRGNELESRFDGMAEWSLDDWKSKQRNGKGRRSISGVPNGKGIIV